MSRVLCITGMHRSGTSLTASWLQRCGLVIDIGGLMGPALGNPLGHFEDEEIERLHRRQILLRHPRSGGWRLTRPEFLRLSPGRRAQAARLVQRRSAEFDQWGWKDPRSVAFLPEWERVVPGLAVLVVWRPAPDVVDSLLRRARRPGSTRRIQVDERDAWRMWVAYNSLACAFKRRHPERVLLVPIERVVDAHDAVLATLRDRFGLRLDGAALHDTFDPAQLTTTGDAAAASSYPAELRPLVRSAAEVEEQLRELSD